MLSSSAEARKPYAFIPLTEEGGSNSRTGGNNAPFPPSLHTREGRESMTKW